MTEREKVLLQREAAAKALDNYLPVGDWSCARIQRLVAELFPMPKRTRPRVVQVYHSEYRVVDGCLQRRLADPCSAWSDAAEPLCHHTAAELRALADLLDNPTEEVEDEDA